MRRARDAIDLLLAPYGPRAAKGPHKTVYAEIMRRREYGNTPDGFPPSSLSAMPALKHPSSQPALRTGPEDPMRKKREPGFKDDTSVEQAVQSREDDGCDKCAGLGHVTIETEGSTIVRTCSECGGSGLRWGDPVGEACLEILTRVAEGAGAFIIAARKIPVVMEAKAQLHDEAQPVPCNGCHGLIYGGPKDPIRDGFCSPCSTAWYTWHKLPENKTDDKGADKMRFEEQRRRHEGHDATTCGRCVELAQRADAGWKIDRGIVV